MGTLEPGASLVIEPPPKVDSDRSNDPVSKTGLQLISPDGKVYPLNFSVTKVGRARECQVWLESDKVSRNHAELRQTAEAPEIVDLGSTNGTFVNGERIQPQLPQYLQVGDEIRFGDRMFTLSIR